MKRNLLFTTLALTFITVSAQSSADIALEKFLSQDLLFRDECISNPNNTDCQIIKAALLNAYKHGCSHRYLTKNEQSIQNEYNHLLNQNQSIYRSLRTFPQIKRIHDEMITYHVSKLIFENEENRVELEAAAIRLILDSMTHIQPIFKPISDKEHIYQNQQLKLFDQSMTNAFENKNQNQQKI